MHYRRRRTETRERWRRCIGELGGGADEYLRREDKVVALKQRYPRTLKRWR